MPTCGQCTGPCNCYVTEDGFFSGNPEEGRNTTQLSGSGTTEDPYVVHFLDQEEFRPRTAEFTFSNFTMAASSGADSGDIKVIGSLSPGHTVQYVSPINFIIGDPSTGGSTGYDGNPRYLQGHYWIIGATITYAQAADTASDYRYLLVAAAQGSVGSINLPVVAAQTTSGGGSDPLTLSCEGFFPGVWTPVSGLASIIQQFEVYGFQDSGGPLAVSELKVWITQI